jgi:UPF0042 nucleotide-binding protein
MSLAAVVISFGYLHAAAPPADLTVDLRESYRDPHACPALRELTAADPAVAAAVLATPGIPALVSAVTAAARDLLGAGSPVTVAIGCAGGRHRAPAVADRVAARLEAGGVTVTAVHRDIGKPVVRRDPAAAPGAEGGGAVTGRAGWAYGRDDGGEWLTIDEAGHQAPVLYPARELAEAALDAGSLRDAGLSVAHVAEVSQPGGGGPAYWITPGTCRKRATR